jgi:hypothetical protein
MTLFALMPGCTSFLMTTWATSRDKATKAQRGTHYLIRSRASFDLLNGDLETEPTNGRQVATLTALEEFIKLGASHPSCFCSSMTTTQIRRAPPRVQAGEKHNIYMSCSCQIFPQSRRSLMSHVSIIYSQYVYISHLLMYPGGLF